MKKFFLFIFTLISSLIICCNALAYNPADIAEKIENFEPEIKIDISDINSALSDTFDYDPRLILYFKGYNGTYNSFSSTVNIIYDNQDTPINNIYTAENKDEFINLITRALLYNKDKVHIVIKDMPSSSTSVNDLIAGISESCPIAFMGYRGSSVSALDSKIGGYSYYIIDFQYDFDSDTLLQMKKDLQQKACEIVASNIAKNMPPYMKVYIIHNYIVNNCKYATDYETNKNPYYYTAYGALLNGKAVCDGYASAAKILFDLCGIENIKVTGTSKGNGHAWNLIKLDNDYYHIDTTWDDPVSYDGLDYLKYNYYNLTDNEISIDHAWKTQNYPDANGTAYSYKKTVELIKNDSSTYTEGYTSFESVFGKYPPLTGSTNPNIKPADITENITDNYIKPSAILDKADINLKTTFFDMLDFFIMSVNENPVFYLKLCSVLVLLLILKRLFHKR